jgi:hypothetical protein
MVELKHLTITEDNFSVIRAELKARNSVRVNNKVNLVSFIANTQYISDKGNEVRTPFYYIADDGRKFIAKTLKEFLGLQPETKGERKSTTFAALWEQVSRKAEEASDEELTEAIEHLQGILDARKAEAEAKAKAEAEAEQATLAMLAAKYGYSLKTEAKAKTASRKRK